MKLNVYVPTIDALGIDPGSGIVGSIQPATVGNDPDMLVIDYEGNRYGTVNIVTYADRIAYAAGRHTRNYPTVARQWLSPSSTAESVLQVGEFDTTTGVVTLSEPIFVMSWCTLTAEQLPAELLTTSHRDQMTRHFLTTPECAFCGALIVGESYRWVDEVTWRGNEAKVYCNEECSSNYAERAASS